MFSRSSSLYFFVTLVLQISWSTRNASTQPRSYNALYIANVQHTGVFRYEYKYGLLKHSRFSPPLPCPHLRAVVAQVLGGVLQPRGLLPLIRCMCLVRFIELGKELNIRDQGMDLPQHRIGRCEVGVIVPNLYNTKTVPKIVRNPSFTWIMSSLSLGETESPQISSPLVRSSSNCSPMAARSNSFQTLGVSPFLHLILQVPPLQMWGSSHSGCLSSRIRW